MITHFGNAAKGGASCGACERYCVEHACAVCSEYECATHLAASATVAQVTDKAPNEPVIPVTHLTTPEKPASPLL